MVRAGVPQSVAKRISGHSTDVVFRRYDIVDEQDLREASKKVEAYNRHIADKTMASIIPMIPKKEPSSEFA